MLEEEELDIWELIKFILIILGVVVLCETLEEFLTGLGAKLRGLGLKDTVKYLESARYYFDQGTKETRYSDCIVNCRNTFQSCIKSITGENKEHYWRK